MKDDDEQGWWKRYLNDNDAVLKQLGIGIVLGFGLIAAGIFVLKRVNGAK
jgi:hypothetical protein